MTDPMTMDHARRLAAQDCPLPSLAGPALRLLLEQFDAQAKQLGEMKRRACFAHALCFELSKKHPEVSDLGDDGALHCAIHAVLAVDATSAVTRGAMPGEGVPAPWIAPPVPSRFQIGEQVRAGSIKGEVVAVTFAVINEQAMVLYDISHSGGVLMRVCSGRVQSGSPAHLRAVPDTAEALSSSEPNRPRCPDFPNCPNLGCRCEDKQ